MEKGFSNPLQKIAQKWLGQRKGLQNPSPYSGEDVLELGDDEIVESRAVETSFWFVGEFI
ncbi:MAG: hypothetical protein EAZ42_12160 [Verrucomicrobia bacterium]|nr:MAG: hypothetical protein EAZ42_12160 [Verrucomicrobiota bacterium]